MSRQWLIPGVGVIDDDGEEEYLIPAGTGVVGERQLAAVAAPLPHVSRIGD